MAQDTLQSRSKSRIIIVEDDLPLLKSAVKYLTLDGYEVTGVGTAHEFYKQIYSEPYDVAILDIGLPDQNGLVLAEYVRKNTNMRIIMLTALVTLDDQLAGHRAGADIYLVKPIDFRRLSASIATLLSRLADTPVTSPAATETHSPEPSERWRLFSKQWTLETPGGARIKLTPKELDLMVQMATIPTAVVTRQDLLNKLGYFDTESGNHSLQALINRLREKIKAHTITSPIQTAHAIGYIFSADITIE
ncbi:MAG: response regulator transcription factor [Chlorobiaceae bacterium]